VRILLTGGSGLLGKTLKGLEAGIVAPTHAEMDVCDGDAVLGTFRAHRPAIVIHAAAIVGTRPCGADPQHCLDVNVAGTLHVVRAAREVSARMIYISTDYVFDGEAGHYRETDPIRPINLYGRSKAAGEMIALAMDGALVVRTSFCASSGWKYDGAFTDQYSSRDTVDRIAPDVLAAGRSSLTGIVHIAGERRSLFDLARSLEPSVKPLSIGAMNLDLPRDVSLDCTHWRSVRGA
jgi:dTDP-4-dehydrorhamnose reductase